MSQRMAVPARILAGLASLLAGVAPASAQPANGPDLRVFVPSTVSPQARETFAAMGEVFKDAATPLPRTTDGLIQKRREIEEAAGGASHQIIAALSTQVAPSTRGGTPVLELRPKDYADDGTVLIYVHGGGYTFLSAKSSAGAAALMAHAAKREIISVDYTLAPEAKWPQITDQVIAVYKSLLKEGRAPASIGMFGDSAGGAIIGGAVLKMRDQGVPLPGALVLISPATDLRSQGDTFVTLAAADPMTTYENERVGAEAYAAPADQTNPYVSPVFGDFSKPYPPVLIQGGTKEMMLSDFVRLNRAIKAGGGRSELSLFEGMTHTFQEVMPTTPESHAAYAEAAAFWAHTLTPQAAGSRGAPAKSDGSR